MLGPDRIVPDSLIDGFAGGQLSGPRFGRSDVQPWRPPRWEPCARSALRPDARQQARYAVQEFRGARAEPAAFSDSLSNMAGLAGSAGSLRSSRNGVTNASSRSPSTSKWKGSSGSAAACGEAGFGLGMAAAHHGRVEPLFDHLAGAGFDHGLVPQDRLAMGLLVKVVLDAVGLLGSQADLSPNERVRVSDARK